MEESREFSIVGILLVLIAVVVVVYIYYHAFTTHEVVPQHQPAPPARINHPDD